MPRQSYWRRYLAVGVLSLLKALAVRGHGERVRTELIDAGLFLALAVLVRYVEGDSDADGDRPSVVGELRRWMGTDDERQPLATLEEYLDTRDLPDSYRGRLSPRLSNAGSEPESTTLRERMPIG